MTIKPMTLEEATEQIQAFNGSARAEWMRDVLRSYALHVIETSRPQPIEEHVVIEPLYEYGYDKAIADYHAAAVELIEKGV